MPILCPNSECRSKLKLLNVKKSNKKQKAYYSICDYVCVNPYCSTGLVIVEKTQGKPDLKYAKARKKNPEVVNNWISV